MTEVIAGTGVLAGADVLQDADDTGPGSSELAVATMLSAPPATESTDRSASGGSILLSVSAGMVGLLSYAAGLVMTHLLTPADYGRFAAAQVLLTAAGTAASALIPLPLAHMVRRHRAGSAERTDSIAFAVGVACCAGLITAIVSGILTIGFATPPVAVAVAVSAFAVFMVAPVRGWWQGEGRFTRYATTSVLEVVVRLVAGVAVVVAGLGAAGAVAGFGAGALVVAGLGVSTVARELRWKPAVLRDRQRWSETGAIAVTQLVLSMIVAADVLTAAFVGGGSADAAGFQALATLTKGPVYVAAGCVLVIFPVLRTGGPTVAAQLRRAVGTFAKIAAVAALVFGTMPVAVVGLVLPPGYLAATAELPWLAVAGVAYGLMMVLATALLGVGHGGRSRAGLALATVLLAAGLLTGHAAGGIYGLAVGGTVGAVGGAVALVALAVRVLPAGSLRGAATVAAAAVPAAVVLGYGSRWVPVWCAMAALVVAVGGRGLLGPRSRVAATRPDTRLRILHLGFEDPAQPGSGGGALRTHETGRRIARHHDLTVLVQRFPGCTDRTEDGVRYVHVGFGSGRNRLTRVLGYMLLLPVAVRRRSADLVVEDFFAPVSSIGVPLWSGRPTVGVVQWLNAREKAAQFKVPVHLVERFGVRSHRRLVAVSEGIRERLLAVNPGLRVDVIGNGLAPEAFEPAPRLGTGVVFVGRLETAHKGIDLLLDAWALAGAVIPDELVIAGIGPDEDRLRARAAELGITERVRFVGWVSGAEKFELIASSRLMAVPSRFETFGIVAVEAAATGTPVVAFDIDCLREVVPPECGRRTPPFDVGAYADALIEAYADEEWILGSTDDRRRFARTHDWDSVAAHQERFYVDAAHAGRRGGLRGGTEGAPR